MSNWHFVMGSFYNSIYVNLIGLQIPFYVNMCIYDILTCRRTVNDLVRLCRWSMPYWCHTIINARRFSSISISSFRRFNLFHVRKCKLCQTVSFPRAVNKWIISYSHSLIWLSNLMWWALKRIISAKRFYFVPTRWCYTYIYIYIYIYTEQLYNTFRFLSTML